MTIVAGIVIAAIAVGVAVLAVVLVRFNVKRRHIVRAAENATDAQLELIYRLVEAQGTQASTGCVLARTNRVAPSDAAIVSIPPWLEASPWAGRAIAVEAAPDVTFRFLTTPVAESQFRGKIYRAVRVPRTTSKRGTRRNRFSPKRYLAGNAELARALAAVCARYPEALLGYLLCVGRENHEFDPIDQARIGTPPAWIQDPEVPSCARCSQRLTLIVQLPGTLLAERAARRGTFYLFGCPTHPEETARVGQFT